jgi:transcriptional regulator with XRE-family HTH domain
MPEINAQNANTVNAYTGNTSQQYPFVSRKSDTPPSPFWNRLAEAWKAKGLATSQNGVAERLGMSQGSTRRWYTGEGYPEIEVLRRIAELGDVTIDWLLTETLPRSPIRKGSPLGRLMTVWEQLSENGKQHVFESASGQLAHQRAQDGPESLKKTPK